MGQKTVRFSDLSGQLIMDDNALARIVVHEHPELVDGPVEIEALTGEAEAMEQAALRVAVVEVYLPDDIEPRRIVMEADAFDDHTTLEHAGKPHKGKTTDVEKQLVREHFDQINERLAAQGLRTISLTDPDHIERYGLQQFARERHAELEFDLGAEDDNGVAAG